MLVGDPAAPVLEPADARHLERVLRLAPGEVVVATDGRGRWTRCRYRGGGTLDVDGPVELDAAPFPALTVAFAPVKAERPEWVVQKLTELGVDRIVVLSTTRSVVRWDSGRARAVLDRLRRVATAAAAQARRVWLPEVAGVVGLGDLEDLVGLEDLEGLEGIEDLEGIETVSGVPGRAGSDRSGIALAEPGGPPPAPELTTIAVGPEGGWSPEELSSGLPTVGLSAHVLRAETAAIAAGVLLGALRAGTVSRHRL